MGTSQSSHTHAHTHTHTHTNSGRLVDAAEWHEEHLPLEDGGMTVNGAVKALQTKGACLEKDWGFDLDKVSKCVLAK